jgi:hypothetical protein
LVAEAGRVFRLRVATPFVTVTGLPSAVVPLKNVTVPDGKLAPVLVDVMFAVSTTFCPKTGLLGENVTVVVVVASPTVTVVAGESLEVNVLSPEYWAVIELAPVGRARGARLPTPLVRVAVPSDVVPLKNVTVPVGVPVSGLTGATVAVSVTSSP